MMLKSIVKLILSPIKKLRGYLVRNFLYKYQHHAFSLAFQDEIEEWQPDVAHCNDWQTLSLGERLKTKCGAHLIFDSHELETHRNPPLPERRKKWMEAYERKLFASCDLITTVCDPISDYLSNAYDIQKPAVIYNAPVKIDGNFGLERWGRITSSSDVRSEARCEGDTFLMVMVGNVTVNRGFETTLKAMQTLPENIHLAIVGSIVIGFDKILFELIEKYRLNERVHIITPVNPNCVVDFIKTADVGLISLIPVTLSYNFALPNKLFECVFAGLPLIASDTYEIEKKVKMYALGSLYKAGDVEGLKASILERHLYWKTSEKKHQPNVQFLADHDFENSAQKVLDFISSSRAN